MLDGTLIHQSAISMVLITILVSASFSRRSDISTGAIVGLEALSRWNSKKFGSVRPDEFISVAEETGLIVPLGKVTFNKVIKDIISWREMGIELPTIAVNLSAKQIYSDETHSMIKQVMQDGKLDGVELEFEITESSLMDNPQLAEKKISAIKALGVNIALDDFGTGFSSFSNLRRYPLDELKIDRSFVSQLCSRGDSRAIVETILNLANSLGIGVVAEGIETADQVEDHADGHQRDR